MLGDIFYRHVGKVVFHRTVDFETAKIETSISGDVTLKDETTAIDNFTYWSIPRSDGVYYSEGQGVVISKDGLQKASWKSIAIGRYVDDGGTKTDRGSAFFKTKSSGALGFLDNMMGIYEYEIDSKGNTIGKMWHWK